MIVPENGSIRQCHSQDDPKILRRLPSINENNPSDTNMKSTDNLDEASSDCNEFRMKRHVGLFSCVTFVIGTMIGSGIFISPGNVLMRVQSPGLCLVIWGTSGLYALLGALSYCEIGTLIPKSGGEYAYLLEAFGPLHKFFGPILAFQYVFVTGLLRRPMSTALLTLSFATYFSSPILKALDFCPNSYRAKIIHQLIGCLCVGFISFINCYSVKAAVQVQNVFTVAKLSVIAVIIGAGLYNLSLGYTENLEIGFEGSTTSVGKIAQGFYGCLYAYKGWNALNYMMEELKNPYRNFPLAIIIAIPLTTVCYVLVNVSYLTVLSPQEIISSEAVAESWGSKVLLSAGFLIPCGVVISTIGTFNSAVFTTGRLFYAAAREGHIPKILSYIHIERRTPIPSILFNSCLGILFIIPGSVGKLLELTSFATAIFDCIVMMALIVMRFTKKDQHRPIKVPIIIPIIVMIGSACLFVAPIVLTPQLEYFYVIVFILLGFIYYVPFVYYKKTLPGTHGVIRFIQKTFLVAPTTDQHPK